MSQLTIVNDYKSAWEDCLKGDPVRPHIPAWQRVAANRQYFLLNDFHRVLAVTCVAYLDHVPETEEELFEEYCSAFDVCCFYTIWSNEKGCGRELLEKVFRHNKIYRPNLKFNCTLSPKTEMARKFHLSNGAGLFRENKLTDNYVYGINTLLEKTTMMVA